VTGAPRADLAWAKGGHAEVVRVERDAIELRSTTPAPPGARLEATLGAPPAQPVKIKSHGSRREPDGAFALKGRILDATRELRDRLAALAALPPT
jgi:hypothetical protein